MILATLKIVEPFSGQPDYAIMAMVLLPYLGYVCYLYRRRQGGDGVLLVRRALWASLWLGYVFKGTRASCTSFVFYGMMAVSLLGLSLFGICTRRSHAAHRRSMPVLYAMYCCWLVCAQSLAITSDPRLSLREFVVISVSWFTIYQVFARYDSSEHFLHDMFAGFQFLAWVVLAVSSAFYVCWGALAFEEGRFAGPFSSANYFGLCAGVLLIGLGYEKLYRDEDTRMGWSHSVASLGLLSLLILTMSRGAILFGAGSFMVLSLLSSRRAFFWLLASLCGVVVSLGCISGQTYDRFVSRANASDSGRLGLLSEQYEQAKEKYFLGHGLGVSKITDFSLCPVSGYEISSHNYMVSTFYDLGMVGCVVAAGLLLAAVYRHLVQLRSQFRTSCFALTVLCAGLLYSNVENIFWNGNGMSDLLIVAVVCMATRVEDGAATLTYR